VAQYLPLLVMLILATLFAGLSFLASGLLGQRKRPTLAKLAPYECGIVPDREPAERFPVRFYLVAMIFIIFDIEIIFLFPWAVIYRQLGAFGLWEMIIFAGAVFLSFVYLLGRGALNWGPPKPAQPISGAPVGMRADDRSAESTIRRVGDEGRVPAAVSSAADSGGPSGDGPSRGGQAA
jgi:NADH-quinone oxidoreductase subunit A